MRYGTALLFHSRVLACEADALQQMDHAGTKRAVGPSAWQGYRKFSCCCHQNSHLANAVGCRRHTAATSCFLEAIVHRTVHTSHGRPYVRKGTSKSDVHVECCAPVGCSPCRSHIEWSSANAETHQTAYSHNSQLIGGRLFDLSPWAA